MAFSCCFLPLEWLTRSYFLYVIICKVLLWHCWKVRPVVWVRRAGDTVICGSAQSTQESETKERNWIRSVWAAVWHFSPQQTSVTCHTGHFTGVLSTWAHIKISLLHLVAAVEVLNFYVWKCFCIDDALKVFLLCCRPFSAVNSYFWSYGCVGLWIKKNKGGGEPSKQSLTVISGIKLHLWHRGRTRV